MDYKINAPLDVETAMELYRSTSLGERRPLHDAACMTQMLQHANLVVTAWDGNTLMGIARSLTDWCYCCYLADLAVRTSQQRAGIGKELIRRTQDALGDKAKIILLAAPAAVEYYPHIGFEQHPSAWVIPARQTLR